MPSERNVLGEPLTPCCQSPATGFLRDGYCRHLRRDRGRHEICAVMDPWFLEYSKLQGNDLVTARPELHFPGLEPGDRWCVCVSRWIEAEAVGAAPAVVLSATHEAVLEDVSLETLESYAVDGGGGSFDPFDGGDGSFESFDGDDGSFESFDGGDGSFESFDGDDGSFESFDGEDDVDGGESDGANTDRDDHEP